VRDECRPESEAVLGSDAARRNVQRMVSEQGVGAAANRTDTEARTVLLKRFPFAAEIGTKLRFLGVRDG
jgi:hypothetical protein